MTRVVGIDPGTKSFDFFGLEYDNIILDKSVSTKDISKDPELISDILLKTKPDLVVGPSGYGIPVTKIEDIKEKDLFLISLINKEDKKSIFGMRKSLERLKKNRLPVYFIPSVIHLPTVPMHRKINKIDMGTADKLCSSALAIWDQARKYQISYTECNFILLELGYGYNAAIAVQNGKIVDGIGGTTGCIGFLSLGGMDSELAYLIRGFDKELLFKGGVQSLIGSDITPEELSFLINTIDGEKYYIAWKALIEGIIKNALMLTVSVNPREILLSGRLSKIIELKKELSEKLKNIAPVRNLNGFPKAKIAKNAAQGAALIANGLAGGKYKDLIETMRIKSAKGTALDYINLPPIYELKKKYGIP